MILQKKSSLATKAVLASLMGSLLLLNGCDKQADTPEVTANTSTSTSTANNAATENSASNNTDQGHTNHEDHMSDAHSSTEHESHEANDMHHDEANHEGHDHEEHNHEGHEGHDHDSARIKFSCDPTKTIGVFYHADSNPKTAHLLIDGIEYDLTQVPSASGDKYTTEIGINEGQGMSWNVTDNGALLKTMTLDHTAKVDDEKVLYSCKKAS